MKYETESLIKAIILLLEKNDVPREGCEFFAESLIQAEMRGVSSHGLTRLKTYVRRLEQGLVDAKAEPEIIRDNPSLLLIDAHNSLGVYSAAYAMEKCMEKAVISGACFASVQGGNHFGIGQFITDIAARKNMIGLAMSNGPSAIAPIGGREPLIGTNPLSISIPLADGTSLSLDMASSMVARGKVALAQKQDQKIPLGWGIDKEGNPTDDPSEVYCMLPFGGAKGYGIALIIEILCGSLSAAGNSKSVGSFYDMSGKTQNLGFFVGAVHIESLMPIDVYKRKVSEITENVHNSPRAANVKRIYLPGEIELEKSADAETSGIEISGRVLEEMKALLNEYCLDAEQYLREK